MVTFQLKNINVFKSFKKKCGHDQVSCHDTLVPMQKCFKKFQGSYTPGTRRGNANKRHKYANDSPVNHLNVEHTNAYASKIRSATEVWVVSVALEKNRSQLEIWVR